MTPNPKPGVRTSEFWAVVAANVGGVAAAAQGVLPPRYAALISTVSIAAYAIARGLAKKPVPPVN